MGWDTVTGWGGANWTAFAAAIAPPVQVAPTSATIFQGPPVQGQSATGSVAFLSAADNVSYSVQSVPSSAGQVAAAEITYTLTTSPANLEDLNLTLVTEGPSLVTQFVYIYNFQTNAWDTKPAWSTMTNGTDQTMNVDIDMTKYVGPGNSVKIINRGVLPTRFGNTSYRLNTDQAVLVESF